MNNPKPGWTEIGGAAILTGAAYGFHVLCTWIGAEWLFWCIIFLLWLGLMMRA